MGGRGDVEMARLLVQHGADLYARTEGDVPFAVARLNGHDAICDMLKPLMDEAQAKDRQVWVRSRIKQLEREVRRLEESLK